MVQGYERRKHIRIPVRILTDIYEKSGLLGGRGCVVDISAGGVGVESELNLSVMTDVYLFVLFPPISIKVFGTIVHKQKKMVGLYKYGIIFTKTNLLEILKLRRYIKKTVEVSS